MTRIWPLGSTVKSCEKSCKTSCKPELKLNLAAAMTGIEIRHGDLPDGIASQIDLTQDIQGGSRIQRSWWEDVG